MHKQVILIRKDLKLSKGKTAVQAAHASLEAYKRAEPRIRALWEKEGSKKVVLAVEDLKTLMEIYNTAKKMRLPCSLIKDAGKTEVEAGTITAVALGPCEEEKIETITGKFKLL